MAGNSKIRRNRYGGKQLQLERYGGKSKDTKDMAGNRKYERYGGKSKDTIDMAGRFTAACRLSVRRPGPLALRLSTMNNNYVSTTASTIGQGQAINLLPELWNAFSIATHVCRDPFGVLRHCSCRQRLDRSRRSRRRHRRRHFLLHCRAA